MVDQNSNEAMSDDELERELRALLDVEPSRDFVARVRTDVHADAIADVWLTGRWIAVAAAAVVIVGVSAWMATRSGQPLTSPAAIVSQQVPSVPSVRSLAPPAVPSSAPQTAAPAASIPEIIVSPRESAGLRYLLAALREGRLDSSAMPNDETAVTDMPIVIDPITVEPLVAAADLETGAGQ
jgi:hypothetical protein